MAKINIIVRGIAMSYHKNDGMWKILFPFGSSHLINFKETDNDKGVSLAESGRQIKITTENAKSGFSIGESYEDFLDLTNEYSHSDGVKLRNGWEEQAVLMTVENAKFSVKEYTEYEHFMLKEENVTSKPKKIGYSGRFEIEAEKLIIHVDDHSEFPKTYESDTTLIFDNDCYDKKPKTSSDFEMIYNVIEDVNSSIQKFTVVTVTEEVESESIFPGADFTPPDYTKLTYRDPLNKALPCHMVRISNADYLI